MRILFLGDIVGRPGRDAVVSRLPELKKQLAADVAIVNGENAAHGFGITAKICEQLFAAGADCITTGNHTWDQREIISYIGDEPRLIRPINYPKGTPGRGAIVVEPRQGQKILVINAMGRLYMDPLDDPFAAMERVMDAYRLGRDVSAIILDFHAEATSEKMAMGSHCDGRVSFVVGTHTHVPTADTQILAGGTAYQSDAGMCGDYDSVIGMKKNGATQRFIRRMPGERLIPSDGEATVCGTFVVTDDETGLAVSIEPVRLGGRLSQQVPVTAD